MFQRLLLIAVAVFLSGAAGVAIGQPAAGSASLVGGIEAYQVFPRVRMEGVISFIALRPGNLKADVIRDADNLTISSPNWVVNAPSQSLSIGNIPVGGEYTVRFTSGSDAQVFAHILVGEIWVVGGGSNACGAEGIADPPVPQVHMLQNTWQEGKDPLFNLPHIPFLQGKTIVTAWMRAAHNYYQRTGIPVGLMGYCAPAKDIDFFMDPTHTDAPIFKALVEQRGKGASVFCWYQGEADKQLEQTRVYKERLKALAAALRRYSGDPKMKMVVIQLAREISVNALPVTGTGDIREMQRRFCAEDLSAILIPAQPYTPRDGLHLGSDRLRQLAARVAQALEEAKNNMDRPVWQGPRLASARVVGYSRRRVEARFENARRLVLTSDPDETGDPEAKWKAQWLVTDPKHQGFPRAPRPEVKNGVLTMELSGGTIGPPRLDPQGHVMQAKVENSGFIMPMTVELDGVTINIDLPEPALPGAKLYFAYLDGAKGYLTDERGKPAAAFAEVPISGP